ncbi:MAG: acylphosphatase [Candidatus Riflebacteria bacterium]|jgi:acylphosphatase|nr:acylphosphatase [Candidatus Riflebacteria bacterium]
MANQNFLRVRLVIRGRVQGVGFRRYVDKQAQSLGVGGWVRNNPDGSVETEAEGDSQMIQQFKADMQKGPFFSRVDEVEEVLRETLPQKPGSLFTIRHG